MRKLLFILLIVFTFHKIAIACINSETQKLKDGTIIAIDPTHVDVPAGHHFVKINYREKLQELNNLWLQTKDIAYLSDCGVLYILQGKFSDAKKLYLNIESLSPNRYSTASNLGTVYELMGQNDSALLWIRKAVKINPESHHNSEWIHVNILEAKLKGEQSYTSSFLLNNSFGEKTIPESKLSKQTLTKLSVALYYQLNERLSFIKPNDKIIATLLFELGNIYWILDKKYAALEIYRKAEKYGYKTSLLKQRYEDLKQSTKK